MSEELPPQAPPPMPPGAPSSLPAPTGDADRGPRMPWEERDRLGYGDALIETVKLLLTAPGDAFSRLRADGDLIWPLVFGLIFSWIGQFFTQMWNLLFGEATRGLLDGLEGLGDYAQITTSNLPTAVVSVVLWPLIFVIAIFIGAGIFHLCLMLVGATDESPLGFEGTLKVLAYSQIANLAGVVPILGGLIAAIASLVLCVIGFTKVHRTSAGKATVAALIPVAICCICCGIVLALVVGGGLAAALAAGG